MASQHDIIKRALVGVQSSWLKLFNHDLLETCITNALFGAHLVDKAICPPPENILEAFKYFDVDEVKCVIIGQDPYYTPGVAHGLSFSIKVGNKFQPSLRNIFKAVISNGYMKELPQHGNLEKWADQGVLLLNTYLTTLEGSAKAHKFWIKFTQDLISKLGSNENIIYLLWGKEAQKLAKDVKGIKLEFGHPSPLSRGTKFVECDHFKKVNKLLVERGLIPIDWNLND